MTIKLNRHDVCKVLIALTEVSAEFGIRLAGYDDPEDLQNEYVQRILSEKQMWDDIHDDIKRQLEAWDKAQEEMKARREYYDK